MAAERDELEYLRRENGQLTDQIMAKRKDARELREALEQVQGEHYRAVMRDDAVKTLRLRLDAVEERLHEEVKKLATVLSLLGDFSYDVDWTGEVVALEHHRTDGGLCLISAGMYGHNVKDLVWAAVNHECKERVLP